MSEAPADPPPQPAEPSGFPFRPIHFLYAVALFASAVVTFGCLGVMPAVLIILLWAYVIARRPRPLASLVDCLAILHLTVFLLGFLLLPWLGLAVIDPPEMFWRQGCKNNLKQIGLALHDYHETYGTLPPAYIAKQNERSMHSWRALLWPFIERSQLYPKGLYLKYNFHQPWDSPNNGELVSGMPYVYACPEATDSSNGHGNYTSYAAVIGPRTAWPGLVGRRFTDFKDGTSNTILLVECKPGDILWAEPRDLTVEEALDLLVPSEPWTAPNHHWENFFYEYAGGRNVLFADGSVEHVPCGADRDHLRSLITIDDGGVRPDRDHWYQLWKETKRLRIDRCCAFGVFVLLTFLPLPWIWLKPRSARRVPSGTAPE